MEAAGTAGVAFQQLVDRVSDVAAAKGITRLSVSATAEPGEGPRDLSLLGKAVPMLPRLSVSVALEMMLEFTGLQPGAEITVAGPAADYQRVEDAVFALARVAAKTAGSLRLEFQFATPLPPTADEIARIRKVLVDLSPGVVRLKAELA